MKMTLRLGHTAIDEDLYATDIPSIFWNRNEMAFANRFSSFARSLTMEVEGRNIDPEGNGYRGLAELSSKTGLIVRAVGSATVERLFAEIEK
jgi:hypothetical protein